MTLSPDLIERIRAVKLFALDSDGVLTDGGVYVDAEGREFRRFDIKDGLGLKRLMAAGIHVAIISSSSCESVLYRARSLGIAEVHLGVEDKLSCLAQICERLQISLQAVAYMGDDLPDLPVMAQVGFSCAPNDAVKAVLERVDLVSSQPGGRGAVREVCCALHQTVVKSKSSDNK